MEITLPKGDPRNKCYLGDCVRGCEICAFDESAASFFCLKVCSVSWDTNQWTHEDMPSRVLDEWNPNENLLFRRCEMKYIVLKRSGLVEGEYERVGIGLECFSHRLFEGGVKITAKIV